MVLGKWVHISWTALSEHLCPVRGRDGLHRAPVRIILAWPGGRRRSGYDRICVSSPLSQPPLHVEDAPELPTPIDSLYMELETLEVSILSSSPRAATSWLAASP